MKVAIAGCGAVGARVARQLLATSGVHELALVDPRGDRAVSVARTLGDRAHAVSAVPSDAAAVVLAGPAGTHASMAEAAVRAGQDVVSVSDAVEDVRLLLALDGAACRAGVRLAVGAGFSPGLSCLLAASLARRVDDADEIHVAKDGTGGPSCARQHHRALSGAAIDWRDGAWVRRRGGSGRELMWFPDPVDARDCYRAALPDALLLVRAVPGLRRVTARMSATRRDRLAARLPMLIPPHAEGAVGAVRAEVRGRVGAQRVVLVAGVAERPAVGAAVVAAATVEWLGAGRLPAPGAFGLAAIDDPIGLLESLASRGVRVQLFDGRPRTDQ